MATEKELKRVVRMVRDAHDNDMAEDGHDMSVLFEALERGYIRGRGATMGGWHLTMSDVTPEGHALLVSRASLKRWTPNWISAAIGIAGFVVAALNSIADSDR